MEGRGSNTSGTSSPEGGSVPMAAVLPPSPGTILARSQQSTILHFIPKVLTPMDLSYPVMKTPNNSSEPTTVVHPSAMVTSPTCLASPSSSVSMSSRTSSPSLDTTQTVNNNNNNTVSIKPDPSPVRVKDFSKLSPSTSPLSSPNSVLSHSPDRSIEPAGRRTSFSVADILDPHKFIGKSQITSSEVSSSIDDSELQSDRSALC
ncbi:unnamed protein product, partial [Meganyctiphanes norvegica]